MNCCLALQKAFDAHCLRTGRAVLLVQVIKHLNTKGGEDSNNLQQAAGEYEVEIEQILQSTAAQVSAFNKQLALQQEESRIAVVIKVRLDFHPASLPFGCPCVRAA